MLVIDRMSDKNDRESYNLYFVVMECEDNDSFYNFDIPCMRECMINPVILGNGCEVFFKTKKDAKATIEKIHSKIMGCLNK